MIFSPDYCCQGQEACTARPMLCSQTAQNKPTDSTFIYCGGEVSRELLCNGGKRMKASEDV